jgi:hypothetical protein
MVSVSMSTILNVESIKNRCEMYVLVLNTSPSQNCLLAG